jgi:hypothetical protein
LCCRRHRCSMLNQHDPSFVSCSLSRVSEKEHQSASALATDDDCVAQTCRQYAGQTVPTVHVVCPHRHHARRTCSAPACDQYHSLPFSSFAREHCPHRSPIPSTSRPSSAHWHSRSRASTRAHDLAVPTRPASRTSHYGDDAGAHAVAYAGLSPDMEGLSRDALQTQEQHPHSLLH